MSRLSHLVSARVLAVLIGAGLLVPLSLGAPPRVGQPVSVAGGPILSVPVDPFMTAEEEQRLLDVLARPLPVDWTQTTLDQVAADLDAHVRTSIDVRALEDLGLTRDLPMSLPSSSSSVPLGANLQAILEQADLTFIIRGGRLTLTTLDDAEDPSKAVIRIYDVTPLVVRPFKDGTRTIDATSLPDTIQTTIDPDTWEALGGPSTMQVVPVRDRALLTIAAPSHVHLKVQNLLDRMNDAPPVPDQEHLRYFDRPAQTMPMMGGMM